jgi:glycosyltransferase involved in cell wall biosynthesis
MKTPSDILPPVAAVIVTRNRIDMLRKTLQSIGQSSYSIDEIIVSDDSLDNDTAAMLKKEFPGVIRIEGPRRGISANRNLGMSRVKSPYILLTDDDMLVDPLFVKLAIMQIVESGADLVFTGTTEYGKVIFPNTLDFLGFASKPYQAGVPYNTANQQCFILSRKLATELPYDEIITSYGYEEMDYGYRVTAAGYRIACVASCSNIHLAPNRDQPFRFEQDACRLYATYKRFAYVDRRPLSALAFLLIAVPHHLLARVRRAGFKTGAYEAISNFRLAARMLKKYLRQSKGPSGLQFISL